MPRASPRAGIAMLPPCRHPTLCHPAWQEGTAWLSKGLHFRVAPAGCFLNSSCAWPPRVGRDIPARLSCPPPPRPERQGRGDSSGVTALAAQLGTCLHGKAHPGNVYRQAGAPACKKRLFHLAETFRSKTQPTHLPVTSSHSQHPPLCSHVLHLTHRGLIHGYGHLPSWAWTSSQLQVRCSPKMGWKRKCSEVMPVAGGTGHHSWRSLAWGGCRESIPLGMICSASGLGFAKHELSGGREGLVPEPCHHWGSARCLSAAAQGRQAASLCHPPCLFPQAFSPSGSPGV